MIAPKNGPSLVPATTLAEMYRTLSPAPLVGRDALRAFYRPELNLVRGNDEADRLKLRLERTDGPFFHAFLVGQPGAGKSTEISRFVEMIDGGYRVLRLSVVNELNPSTFQPMDVLLLIVFQLAQAVEELNRETPNRITLPPALLADLLRFFADEAVSTQAVDSKELEGKAEISLGFPKLWQSFLGLTVAAGGKLKVGYQQETKLVQYRFQMLSTLARLANRFVDECNAALKQFEDKQWLVVIEDFDRPGLSGEALRTVLVEQGGLLEQLPLHFLITIPAWLLYSADAERLPFRQCGRFVLTDTPVFDKKHAPSKAGRAALEAVLFARANPELFAGRAAELLIVASGGNLRELFAMTLEAADRAGLAKREVIGEEDVWKAIRQARANYRNRLGSAKEDAESVPYSILREKLLAVYGMKTECNVPDLALNRLLQTRAILHFNDDHWYGVHPLVVDILKEQGHLEAGAPGGVG